MATHRKPGERESTISLTGDDLETIPPEQVLRARQGARRASAHPPPPEVDDPSMRELTVPLRDPRTLAVPTVGHASPFAPPPFQKGGPSSALPISEMHGDEPALPGPILASHIETPPPSRNSGTFMPISTFPPSTVKSPPPTERGLRDTAEARKERVLGSSSASAPAWVVGYLVLCAILTAIGLVVLYFEHRMLGNVAPP